MNPQDRMHLMPIITPAFPLLGYFRFKPVKKQRDVRRSGGSCPLFLDGHQILFQGSGDKFAKAYDIQKVGIGS